MRSVHTVRYAQCTYGPVCAVYIRSGMRSVHTVRYAQCTYGPVCAVYIRTTTYEISDLHKLFKRKEREE
jgi:hypothetical protein